MMAALAPIALVTLLATVAGSAEPERAGPPPRAPLDFATWSALDDHDELTALQVDEDARRARIAALEPLVADGAVAAEEVDAAAELGRLYHTMGHQMWLVENLATIPDRRSSSTWHEKAVSTFDLVLAVAPTADGAGEATFLRADSARELGRVEDALDGYAQTVDRHPTTGRVAEAAIRVAERELAAGRVKAALHAFDLASGRPGDLRAFALYGRGWCHGALGDPHRASTSLEDALTLLGKEADTPRRARLVDAVLTDVIPFLVANRSLETGRRVFATFGRPDLAREFLARIGAAYAGDGDHPNAITAWRLAIVADPAHPDNPVYQHGILVSTLALGDPEGAAAERERLRFDYGPRSAWRRANKGDVIATHQADALIDQAEAPASPE